MAAPRDFPPIEPSVPEGFFVIGGLGRPHGLRGAIRLHLDVQYPEDYLDLKELWVGSTRYAVAELSFVSAAVALVQLRGIADATAAERLSGTQALLPLSYLPRLEADQWFYHEVVSCEVMDARLGMIGTVLGVAELPAQDALRIAHPSGAEVLVPIVDAFVGSFNRATRTLHTTVPEGLVEVYLAPPGTPENEGERAAE